MSGFSGAVKLGDLNDFINPSQNCVVALTGARRGPSLPRAIYRSIDKRASERGSTSSRPRLCSI